MASVIDALVVTLGLDASKFKQGSDQAQNSLKQTSGEAAKTAKELEARGKQAASFFSAIKVEALSVLAIFTAGMGLKSFVQDTLSSSAQLQNLAGNLQMSATGVQAWQKTFERAGASASDATSLFTSAANEIGKLKTGQGMGEALKGIAMAGGNVNEALKGPREMVLEESRVLEKLNAINPALARARAMQMGLSDAQFAVLKSGPAALEAQVSAQQKLTGLNDDQIKRMAALNARWNDFKTNLEGIGNRMMGELSGKAGPALEFITEKLTQLSDWASTHGNAVVGFFTALAIATAIPMAEVIALTAAVLAVAAGIGYLYDQWTIWMNGGQSSLSGFFQFFADTWASIRTTFGSTIDSITKVFLDWTHIIRDALKLVFALFTGNAGDIRKAWNALVGDLGTYFTDWVGLIKNLGPAILSAFKSAFTAAFDWVKSRAKTIWNAITGKGDAAEPAAVDAAASTVAQVKQVVSSAGKGIADGAFGALISKGEGDYNSVNRGAKGGYKSGTEDLGNMTVAEVMAAQKSGKFNAAGKYQLIGSTLSDAVKTLGLKGDEKFDKGTQDKIFEQYLVNNKRKAIGDYINGKSDNIGAAIKSASMEWASVADPSTGQSHYAGVGNNKASISVAQMTEALQNARAAAGNRSSTSSSEVNIAQMTIQTQATDANGIARDAKLAFSKNPMLAANANTGLS
jgi:hypothetical protein